MAVLALTMLLASVRLTGSPPLPPPGALAEVDSLSDSTVAALQQSILDWYLREGYPFASAGCFLSGDSLAVSIVPGRHAGIEAVRIEGLEHTPPRTLERYFRGDLGGPYDPVDIEEWRERIARIPWVEWTGPFGLVLGRTGDLVVVQPVLEGAAGSFSAGMGFTGGGAFEGDGLLDVRNLLGTGRELRISAARSAWGGTDAALGYTEPWIAGLPLSASVEALQEIPDSAWLSRELELSASWEIDNRLEAGMGWGRWWGFSPEADRGYSYVLGTLSILPRGRTPMGSEGLSATLEGRVGDATGPDSSGLLAQASLSARLDIYSPPFGFGGDLLAGGIVEGPPLYARLERLGGQSTLRGWPENAFRAVRHVVARPEASVGETATRLYLFIDAGLVETVDDIRTPAGFGGGLRGRAGLFSADLAIGIPVGGGPARFYLTALADIL